MSATEKPKVQQWTPATDSSVAPIDSPTCQYPIVDKPLATSYVTENGTVTPTDLLDSLRIRLCTNNGCEAPHRIDRDAVVVAKDKIYEKCEISIGLAHGIEAYGFRQAAPVGILEDDCWDSLAHIIAAMNGLVRECWWVGPDKSRNFQEVYQMGFRALNNATDSLHISQGAKITKPLPVADTHPAINGSSFGAQATEGPKVKIPVVVGGCIGALVILIALIAFIIWRINVSSVRKFNRLAELRAARRKRKQERSSRTATTMMSLSSWNPKLEPGKSGEKGFATNATSAGEKGDDVIAPPEKISQGPVAAKTMGGVRPGSS